ncbi:LysR substrate-binding domain-containing protein [Terasakiella pusilla]|uniref:LysR substrate-binding domain-containing protein n=1 Tax=Terasakiella pusilla TaxID=64973 RepID=UPI003AA865FD
MHYVQLRAFHAVATHGGFSKAAEQLCLTQPAISDQVRKLEEYFGVLLFHRHKRTVRPTELGEQLLVVTRRMFAIESEAIELLSESKQLRTGFLNIAADAPLHVIKMISAFRKEYPGIEISLKRGNSDTVLRQLHDYSADIGVLATKPEDSTVAYIPLRRDPIVCFVPKDHPWADRGSIRVQDLNEQPLVFREKGSTTRRRIEDIFLKKHIRAKIVMIAEGREANREAVAAGIGIGLVSGPEFGYDSRLKALPITGITMEMEEYLVYLKERKHLRLISAFLKSVDEHINDDL